MNTFTHREQKKKWVLPIIVPVGSFKKYLYKVLGYRKPKKEEYYLSGAIIEAYRAPNDLSTEYLVVELTTRVKETRTSYIPY